MVETRTRQDIRARKIERADFDRVVPLMARAFDDDPVLNYVVKQDERRESRLRRMMHLALDRLTYPFDETYVGEGFEGAMFWNPPGQIPHGLLFNLRMLPELARISGLAGLPRMIGALGVMEKKHPKPPHYYLLAIGVEPGLQGQGVGSALLRPMIERCDREAMPSYLESSKERNVPLYERHGYRVTEQLTLGKTGPPVWLMWRDPQ
jgi:ribosomal protein S18 acetylase RimI-like enzyme